MRTILGSKALPSKGGPLSAGLCLTGSIPTANYEEEELPPDPSEETLTIEARFQPLLPESMTKSKDGFLGVSQGRRGRGPPGDRTRDGGPSVCTCLLRMVCALLIFPPSLPSLIQCPLCTQRARPCPTIQAPSLVGELGGISMNL